MFTLPSMMLTMVLLDELYNEKYFLIFLRNFFFAFVNNALLYIILQEDQLLIMVDSSTISIIIKYCTNITEPNNISWPNILSVTFKSRHQHVNKQLLYLYSARPRSTPVVSRAQYKRIPIVELIGFWNVYKCIVSSLSLSIFRLVHQCLPVDVCFSSEIFYQSSVPANYICYSKQNFGPIIPNVSQSVCLSHLLLLY